MRVDSRWLHRSLCAVLVSVFFLPGIARGQNFKVPTSADIHSPLTYVGRIVDSTETPPFRYVPRTYRAYGGRVSDVKSRVYYMMGERLVAYSQSGFFSSVGSLSNLVAQSRQGEGEKYLPFSYYVDPQQDPGNWIIEFADSQRRLYDFTFDDRGYVYMAYSVYGLGIVYDTGGSFQFIRQYRDKDSNDGDTSVPVPYGITHFRDSSGKYYVMTKDSGGSVGEIWDVTDPANAVVVRSMIGAVGVSAATYGGTTFIGRRDSARGLEIRRVDDFVSGSGSTQTIANGAIQDITSDGTNFYAFALNGSGFDVVVARPTSSSTPAFTTQTYSFSSPSLSNIYGVSFGDGYLAVWGRDSAYNNFGAILRVDSAVPTMIVNGSEWHEFYTGATFVLGHEDLYVTNYGGKDYLLYSQLGVGEVYEIGGEPPPPVAPDPKITRSGCGNVGFSCTLTGGSVGGGSTSGWAWSWSISPSSGVSPTSSSSQTYSPSFTTATSYTVTLTATNSVGTNSTSTTFSVAVAPPPVAPDPKITRSGCASIGSSCTLTGGSVGGASTSGWTWGWSISPSSGVSPTSSSSQTYSPSFSTAASYTVTLTATNSVGSNSTSTTFSVGATGCGPGLQSAVLSFNATCTQCDVGETVGMSVSDFFSTYKLQECDQFTWTFGDGTSTTGTGLSYTSVSHAYSSSGSRTARLAITNSTGENYSISKSITVGTAPPPPPPPPCPTGAPPANQIYPGHTCPGGTCETGESVSFTATGFPYQFQSCDTFKWTFGDGASSTSKNPTHAYSEAGSYIATLEVSNTLGKASGTVGVIIVAPDPNDPNDPNCAAPKAIYGQAKVGETNCSTSACGAGQEITFSLFQFTPQSCDTVTWNFGDSTSATGATVTKTFDDAGVYSISVTLSNASGPSTNDSFQLTVGTVTTIKPSGVNFTFTPASPTAGVTDVSFSGSQSGGDPATAWSWTFGDGKTASGKNVTHTFASPGAFYVTLTASNAGGSTSASKTVTAIEESGYALLLPGVIHLGGANHSTWRSDFQSFIPNVSPSNPLTLQLEFNGCLTNPDTKVCEGSHLMKSLRIDKSTFVAEDFFITSIDARGGSGNVILRGSSPMLPQIWMRNYSISSSGTFGQLVPAILLSNQLNAKIETPQLNIGGLRQSRRFRTNLGFVNPNPTKVVMIGQIFDDADGLPVGGGFAISVEPYAFDQRSITGRPDSWYPSLPESLESFSIRIENPTGLQMIGYASEIDNVSNDPIYIPAVTDADLSDEANAELVLPSVAHLNVNAWRSDAAIFNPDNQAISVDLAYFDSTGTKKSEAQGIVIHGKATIMIEDILKNGSFLLPVLEEGKASSGMLKIHTNITTNLYPYVFSRTYSDQGPNGTFGYGTPAFARSKPNVVSEKAAYVAGVRSDASYYTNLGLVSLNSTAPTTVAISLLDATTGNISALRQIEVAPDASIIVPDVIAEFLFSGAAKGTIKVEVVSGGPIWTFGSIIDRQTKDPLYVPGVPEE